jgi:S-(hydroxymethyl)glutathione dehydrogenase / alcohol dehydrogenase
MRAAVLNEHDITGLSVRDDVRTIPLSDVLVRVRIRAAGVCHSDLSAVTGKLGLPAPFVVGHEAAGEVVDVGDGVDEFAAGDRVMVSWVPQCGTCTDCRGDRPELCSYNTEPSYRRPRFLIGDQPIAAQAGCGVFAEEIVVTKHNLVRLPDDVPFDVGALISCGVSTGVGAVRNTARLRGGETVVVIGCGGVGLSIVQAARAAGATSVVAVDPVPVKRELAMTLGASAAIEPAGLADVGGFDVAFEAVGTSRTIRSAYDATRRGGTTVVVGVGSADDTVPFTARELYASGRKIVGSVFGSTDIRRDFPRTLESWRSGQLEVESLIGDRIDLAELPKALEDMRKGTALRTVVVFP